MRRLFLYDIKRHNPPMPTVRVIALAAAIAAVFIGGFLVAWNMRAPVQAKSDAASSTLAAAFAAANAVVAGTNASSTDASVPPIGTTTIKAPLFSEKLSFNGKKKPSADEQTNLSNAYISIVAQLAQNRLDYKAWLSMGTINLLAGNLDASEFIWTYVVQQWPTDYAAHNNLGDLYMNYRDNYPRAESEFLTAINAKPDDPNAYINLLALYLQTPFKASASSTESLLLQGIKENPQTPKIGLMLGQLYMKQGSAAQARVLWNASLDTATRLNQTTIAEQAKSLLGISTSTATTDPETR